MKVHHNQSGRVIGALKEQLERVGTGNSVL